MDLATIIAERRALIEPALQHWLTRITDDAPPSIREAMSYSLMAPGKRLRPILTALACEAVGGRAEQAMAAGCALEMVHAYSLIHDDLPAMDDDDLRRGLPTNHKQFGEALAILAGDALLTGAFQVLAEGYPARTAAVSCVELARGAGAIGMVAGQVLDMAGEGKIPGEPPPTTVAGLERIHSRKTGALFLTALRLGQLAAQGESGVDANAKTALERYGKAFGLAFQIADDILDVEGTAEQIGKGVGKDSARGKLTFPGLLGLEASRRRAHDLYTEAAHALQELGTAAQPLVALAEYVTHRNR